MGDASFHVSTKHKSPAGFPVDKYIALFGEGLMHDIVFLTGKNGSEILKMFRGLILVSVLDINDMFTVIGLVYPCIKIGGKTGNTKSVDSCIVCSEFKFHAYI